jgi:hypothetical protein
VKKVIDKISKQITLKLVKAAERQLDIEAGANFNRHRVHKNKKKYNRKNNKL